MQYQDYSARDFAADPHFIKWIKNADLQTKSYWQQWLAQHPDKKPVVEEARQLVLAMHFKTDPQTTERVNTIWERINHTRQQFTPIPTPVRPMHSNGGIWRNWQRLAAVFVGFLLLTAFLFFTLWKSETATYQTAFGETKNVVLPDGSTVTLNANSTLTVSNNWEMKREVWLKGEAFFAVKKKKITDRKKGIIFSKFTVHANSLQVEVLGTEFNVSGRKQHTTVVLNSGKIRLSLPSEKQNILMKPGDLIEVSGGEQKLTKKVVNPQVYNAWTRKEWILDNLSLPEIAAKIEETYGVKVKITRKEASAAVVTGAVPTENLDILLEALSTTLNLHITHNQQQITIE